MIGYDQLAAVGAILTNTHVVYSSGLHGDVYIDRDRLFLHSIQTSQIALQIAEACKDDMVDTIVGPAIGGIILAKWVAFELEGITGRTIWSISSERETIPLVVAEHESHCIVRHDDVDGDIEVSLEVCEEVLVRKHAFTIRPDYHRCVENKRVLVVDDVLTTGRSVRGTVKAVRNAGGTVTGVAVICNRGQIKEKDLENPPHLFSCIDMPLPAYKEEDCPLCKAGVPINTAVGKGREFLERKRKLRG